MKNFLSIEFDPRTCRSELAQLQHLLQSKQSLSERDDILPFFRERHHLSAFVASYHTWIERFDRVAFEYDIFGDFTADLVVGDSVKKSYCFIEFEDASFNSIFAAQGGRVSPQWSSRFEKGFSQIIDWFWKLNDFEKTDDFENRFNGRPINYMGLLILGRNEALEHREKKRLQWRQENVIVNSKHIYCITFDELYNDLLFRLNKYQLASDVDD